MLGAVQAEAGWNPRPCWNPWKKVSPSSGFYSRSCLGRADNEIFLSPGAQMSVILHGLAAVCAVLASKSLQNRSLFWAFIKKGGKKKRRKGKAARPSFSCGNTNARTISRTCKSSAHSRESAWCDKSSTHVASAWLRLSRRCRKAPRAICRYIMQPSSGELAEFWNLCLVLMFCNVGKWDSCSEWVTVGASKQEHLPTKVAELTHCQVCHWISR